MMTMRWNETCILIAESDPLQLPDGSWAPGGQIETTVFCNPYSVGLESWLASTRDIGLSADAEIQVRTADYDGQTTVWYHDGYYTVERTTVSGEITNLQLGRKVGDVE